LNVGSAEFQDTVSGSGDYQIQIILGDGLLARALVWEIGQVSITVPSTPKKEANTFISQPDIEHKFQVPEKRPSSLVALVFSGLVALPLVGLLLSLLVSRGSFETEIGGATEGLYGLIFQGSLGASVALYFYYWVKLNIFQALGGLVLLGIPAIIAGNQYLKLRHARKKMRLK